MTFQLLLDVTKDSGIFYFHVLVHCVCTSAANFLLDQSQNFNRRIEIKKQLQINFVNNSSNLLFKLIEYHHVQLASVPSETL